MTGLEAFLALKHSLHQIYDDREAENIADWVIENITNKKRWKWKTDNTPLNQQQITLYKKYSEELLQNKPVQYVLNEAWFCGMKFILNGNVLIPRPETEELVYLIAKENKNKKTLSILDIGSGSGCIPIGIKSKLPQANVTSIDVSHEAVETARANADNLKMDVTFFQCDFLDESSWNNFKLYDIIVSNPPYIPATEKSMLDKNVVDFEPNIALFVPDDDPFIFYREIKDFANQHLTGEGKIYLETHENYAGEVLNLFSGHFPKSRLVKDMYGKERMVVAEK